MYPDWQNVVVGKPESDDSKTVRGVVQIASMFAKGVAESGVLSDQSSLAVKALATVAQGQAEAEGHTNRKERTKLGGMLRLSAYSCSRYLFGVLQGSKLYSAYPRVITCSC